MSPPTRESRPAGNRAAKTSGWATAVNTHDSRPIHIDPVTVRLLASTTPCPLCDDRGLCWRCWRIAAVVEELVVAARRDQAADTPVLGVAHERAAAVPADLDR